MYCKIFGRKTFVKWKVIGKKIFQKRKLRNILPNKSVGKKMEAEQACSGSGGGFFPVQQPRKRPFPPETKAFAKTRHRRPSEKSGQESSVQWRSRQTRIQLRSAPLWISDACFRCHYNIYPPFLSSPHYVSCPRRARVLLLVLLRFAFCPHGRIETVCSSVDLNAGNSISWTVFYERMDTVLCRSTVTFSAVASDLRPPFWIQWSEIEKFQLQCISVLPSC